MPRLLARCQRGNREDRSAVLHDRIRKARTRATDSHRLPEKQPHEYISECILATGAPRRGGINAAPLERSGRTARSLDDSVGAAAPAASSSRSMEGLLA